MSDRWPQILSRRTTAVSPWVTLIERDVQFSPGAPPEAYHAMIQADYLAIVARTPDGRIPIVRQFRPALEQFTWELPAGLVDAGEEPAEACRRELLEETGFPARQIISLGTAAPCAARLSNRIHSFFVETGGQIDGFVPESGLTIDLVKPADLRRMILAGEFVLQLHLGTLLLAQMNSLLMLE